MTATAASDGTSTGVGSFNLAALSDEHFAKTGDYESLFFEGKMYSTGELHDRSQRFATGLQSIGVEPGDRVIVLMMNTPEVFVSYNAIWRAGAVVTPVLFLISPVELHHILEHSGAKEAILTPELVPLLQSALDGIDLKMIVVGDAPEGTIPFTSLEADTPSEIVPRADDDLAALLYTGGTTGRSKGVMLTHKGLWSAGSSLHQSANESDLKFTRSLLPLPLSHAYGLMLVCASMHSEERGFSVMQRWFDAASWVTLVEEHRLEVSAMVPSMMTMVLAMPIEEHDLSSMQMFGSGAAPLPMALREEVQRRLGVEIYEGYGLTEASAGVTANKRGFNKPGTVGRPLPGVTVTIQDEEGNILPAGAEGEVCVQGPSVMKGYWNDPEATEFALRGGWLHTGDVGRFDDEGFLTIVDRLKDLIIRGGFNVYPRDVEEVLLQHPDVTQAACVGKPDAESGEEVVAAVALRPGAEVTPAELIEFTKDKLAKYKYPREVRILDAVPLTSVGKTDRKTVRALFASS
ncbi:MAG TPA: AMP-binding protein [Mycobacteriales bacterium]|nr:AMP-binding protein [Mycobacteriales bacterium]